MEPNKHCGNCVSYQEDGWCDWNEEWKTKGQWCLFHQLKKDKMMTDHNMTKLMSRLAALGSDATNMNLSEIEGLAEEAFKKLSEAQRLAEHVLGMGAITAQGLHARDLSRAVLDVPGSFAADRVFITTNGTTRVLSVTEPVFLLRAQDRVAPDAVHHYAHMIGIAGADDTMISGVMKVSDAMRKWGETNATKLPDWPPRPLWDN